MPGPPPAGVSSTARWRPSPCSRMSRASSDHRPRASASPASDWPSGPGNIVGKEGEERHAEHRQPLAFRVDTLTDDRANGERHDRRGALRRFRGAPDKGRYRACARRRTRAFRARAPTGQFRDSPGSLFSTDSMMYKAIFVAAVGLSFSRKIRIARRSSIARRDQKSFTIAPGGSSSRSEPQDSTHLRTDSCSNRSPRSRSSIAAMIPAICHSLTARYSAMASAARNERLRPVLRASASSLALSASSTRMVKVDDAISGTARASLYT